MSGRSRILLSQGQERLSVAAGSLPISPCANIVQLTLLQSAGCALLQEVVDITAEEGYALISGSMTNTGVIDSFIK